MKVQQDARRDEHQDVPQVTLRVRAMASDITITAVGDDARVRSALEQAAEVFRDVERTCTRFDSRSGLMLANASNAQWVAVPRRCLDALAAAAEAYHRTGGRFDPRVYDDLRRLGYERSSSFEAGDVVVSSATVQPRPEMPEWKPRFRRRLGLVHLGGYRVDLGGIGKGLAVRWAAEILRQVTAHFLIEAGGDCYAAGHAPDGEPWRIGVEDPMNPTEPIAVLAVSDCAVATSSVRIRRWTAGGTAVHHLLDPRTGLPGGAGLSAVTVIGADAADAEVDAKTLFLEGHVGIEQAVHGGVAAACWVAADGTATFSPAMAPYLQWRHW